MCDEESLCARLVVSRGVSSVNSVYVKVPIFPDFVDNFTDFHPMSLSYLPILM